MLFLGLFERESLKGLKAQESRRPRPELNLQGSRRGYGFFDGVNPPGLRCQAG
jgi:hypothetical protein